MPSSAGRSRAGEIEAGLKLGGAFATVWLDRNVAVEGQSWFEALLARSDGVDEDVRARALGTASLVAGVRGDYSCVLVWTEEALAHYRAVGAEEGIAWNLTQLATGALLFGRPEEAAPLLEEAEALHRKLGNDGGLRRVLHVQGQQAVDVGDLERGRRLMRESAELHSGSATSSARRARSTRSATSSW